MDPVILSNDRMGLIIITDTAEGIGAELGIDLLQRSRRTFLIDSTRKMSEGLYLGMVRNSAAKKPLKKYTHLSSRDRLTHL